MSLKLRSTVALRWSALDQIVRQILLFGVSVTMARLVAPEAYGTIALLMFFTGLAGVFVDGGLSSALIQKKNTTHTDESTVFWFNLGTGVLMGSVLFFSAPWISRFYGLPVLVPITRIITLQFVLGACNSVQTTLFTKNLDFKTPLKVTSIATIVSAIIGITLAWHGYGIWALVAQTMVAVFVQTLLIWWISPWRPAFIFSSDSFRTLFHFGGYLFLSGLLNTAYNRFYALIIAKLYGVRDLGIYNRADAIKQLPTNVLTGILSRVAFPIFSQTSDDLPRLLRGLRMAIRGVMFLNIPMMMGIACVAEPLILTLFGKEWQAAVPILQILAISGILWPLHVLNLSVLKALGHSGKFLKVEVIKKSVGVALVSGGALYGMHGMAWAVVVSSIFSFVFNAYYNGVLLKYGAWRQVVDFSPALGCGVAMTVAVLLLAQFIDFASPIQLILLSSTGVLAYVACAKILRVKELDDALAHVRSFLTKVTTSTFAK